MKVVPYLNFDGECAEAVQWYAQVLGGTVTRMLTHRDMPGGESLSTEQQGRIMNAVLMIGDQTIMASDSPPGMHAQPRGVWVSLMIDRLEDAKRAFEAFAEGGSVMMPFGETFWAPKGFGMVTDRYGTQWMINCVEDAPAF